MDNIEESEKKCIEFIDEFITCKNDSSIPIIGVQTHRHTHTCYKQKGKKRMCRFGFPHPMMERTQILHPLNEEEEIGRENGKKNYDKIKKRMNDLFKKPQEISFDDILVELEMNEIDYIFAIRSVLKVSKVYLQRSSMDVGINAYNKDILQLFECNMDIQFILNQFAVASYIVNYISKVDSGLSKLLRQAVAETEAGNFTLRNRLQKVLNVFLNAVLISSQEAAYLNLSMPLSKSSRKVIFINTGPKESRVRMLKPVKTLKSMSPNDKNVTVPDVFERYENRVKERETWTIFVLPILQPCIRNARTQRADQKYSNENVQE